jgi:hypothetical protein
MALNESGQLVFISSDSGTSFSYSLYKYLGASPNDLTSDDQGFVYSVTSNGILSLAPGNALPSGTIPIQPITGAWFALFTDARGAQYVLNDSLSAGNTITVYAAGAPSSGTVTREISVLPTTPAHLPLQIAATTNGAIYILFSDGALGYLPANASGGVMPTILRSAQSFNTEQSENTAIAVDTRSQVYLVDGAAANQIDIGSAQLDGTFTVSATLTDPNLPSGASVSLAVDDNNAVYLFSTTGEVDFYRSGLAGTQPPSHVFQQPLVPCCGTAPAIVAGKNFPSPPPSPGVISFSPTSMTLTTAAPSASVAVSETGFKGTFAVLGGTCIDENASPHASANVTPNAGTTFTITANLSVAGSCGITFGDMQGATATYTVSISP